MLGFSLIFGVIAINLFNIIAIFSLKLTSFFKRNRKREIVSREEESHSSNARFYIPRPSWWELQAHGEGVKVVDTDHLDLKERRGERPRRLGRSSFSPNLQEGNVANE